MRKSELLKMPALKLTAGMINTARNDIGVRRNSYSVEYKYSRYYKALEQGGILKVAVWSRERVWKRQQEPDWEIYIDKENRKWQSYCPLENRWSEARIENLSISNSGTAYGDYYGVKGYDDQASVRLVNDYFYAGENKKMSIRYAVLKFQENTAKEKLITHHRQILERIDTVMNRVPEMPKDLETWIVKDAYCKRQYMIYDRSAGKARCTACWGVVDDIKMFRHNGQGKCPVCRAEVTYKSWNMQKTIEDRVNVGVLQRMKDEEGYVLRIFKTHIRYRKNADYSKEIWWSEDGRIVTNNDFGGHKFYVWDKYKNIGPERWVPEYNIGFYKYRTADEEAVIYQKNLDRILKNTEFRYLPARKLFTRRKGSYSKPISFLQGSKQKPQVEVLIKVGLYQAAYEIAIKNYDEVKEWNKESPWEYLGITKEYFKMAVREDMRLGEISVLREATKKNIRISAEQAEFYKKYFYRNIGRIFDMGHTEKMYKYLKALAEQGGGRMGDYLDYLEDLQVLQIPLTKAALFPKDFGKAHTDTAQIRRERDEEIEKAKVTRQNRMFSKILPKIRELYECENESLKVIIPTCKADFQKEGQNNHNCVGGYFKKMLKGACVVVFLRKKEEPEKSFCTVEFDPFGKVRQNRTTYNKEAPLEAVEFIDKLSADVQKKIKKQIMKEEREKAQKERQRAAG